VLFASEASASNVDVSAALVSVGRTDSGVGDTRRGLGGGVGGKGHTCIRLIIIISSSSLTILGTVAERTYCKETTVDARGVDPDVVVVVDVVVVDVEARERSSSSSSGSDRDCDDDDTTGQIICREKYVEVPRSRVRNCARCVVTSVYIIRVEGRTDRIF